MLEPLPFHDLAPFKYFGHILHILRVVVFKVCQCRFVLLPTLNNLLFGLLDSILEFPDLQSRLLKNPSHYCLIYCLDLYLILRQWTVSIGIPLLVDCCSFIFASIMIIHFALIHLCKIFSPGFLGFLELVFHVFLFLELHHKLKKSFSKLQIILNNYELLVMKFSLIFEL